MPSRINYAAPWLVETSQAFQDFLPTRSAEPSLPEVFPRKTIELNDIGPSPPWSVKVSLYNMRNETSGEKERSVFSKFVVTHQKYFETHTLALFHGTESKNYIEICKIEDFSH